MLLDYPKNYAELLDIIESTNDDSYSKIVYGRFIGCSSMDDDNFIAYAVDTNKKEIAFSKMFNQVDVKKMVLWSNEIKSNYPGTNIVILHDHDCSSDCEFNLYICHPFLNDSK